MQKPKKTAAKKRKTPTVAPPKFEEYWKLRMDGATMRLRAAQQIISHTGKDESLIEYVTDRPGHDRRYSLGSEKVRARGWEAQVSFADGLPQTVAWYQENAWWWEPIRSGDFRAYYEKQYGRALGAAPGATGDDA